jgi:hypothetical protein
MTAQELRIGNYISNPSTEICVVSEIQRVLKNGKYEYVIGFDSKGLAYVLNDAQGNEVTKPIPLTEKWLNKCVFKFKELGYENLSVSYGTTSKEIHFVIGSYYVRLNYVHELQNLYFALTKQELTIKL